MEETKEGSQYFDCRCGSDEHTLRFKLVAADEYEGPELFSSIYLNHADPWWKRVWIAIKYIFGYRCRYGHWDCWVMELEDTERMITLCETYIAWHNRWVRKIRGECEPVEQEKGAKDEKRGA